MPQLIENRLVREKSIHQAVRGVLLRSAGIEHDHDQSDTRRTAARSLGAMD